MSSSPLGMPSEVLATHVQHNIMLYLQQNSYPLDVCEEALMSTLFEVMLQARQGDVVLTLSALEHFVAGLIADQIAEGANTMTH